MDLAGHKGLGEVWETVVVEEAVYSIIYLASAFKSHFIFQAVQKRRKWNLSPASWMPSPRTWCRPLTPQRLLEVEGEEVSRPLLGPSREGGPDSPVLPGGWGESGGAGDGKPLGYGFVPPPPNNSLPDLLAFGFLGVACVYLLVS